ncbi:hypothetical protein FHG87_007897 [Trinorchestia longiramus]|nr:hypothetical protein FHG87_007897 [Trinorchestia longiramus]
MDAKKNKYPTNKYHVECATSRPISEVKPYWVWKTLAIKIANDVVLQKVLANSAFGKEGIANIKNNLGRNILVVTMKKRRCFTIPECSRDWSMEGQVLPPSQLNPFSGSNQAFWGGHQQ